MLKRTVTICSIVLAIACCSASAAAQWAVHALSGKMRVVNVSSKTLIVETHDGSDGVFQLPENQKINLSFDKDVRAATIAADKAASNAGEVIVFFFDNGDARTAVAVESIGTEPVNRAVGTVLSFNKHDRQLTVQTDSGAHQTFTITDKTIVDTPDGVAPGRKFSAEPGAHMRLLAESKDGQEQILLIRFDGNAI